MPRTRPSAPRALALALAWGLVSFYAASAAAEPVVVVQPVSDHNDRIRAILGATQPQPRVQQIGLNLMVPPQVWGRASHESEPARLDDARLVVLENAHRNALDDVASDSGASLLDALPGWVREGGHLVVVGGYPSYATYAGSPLAGILPIAPSAEPADAFKRRRRHTLSGSGSDGLYVEHLHPADGSSGETLIRATGPRGESAPFAVVKRVGRGRVLALLGGLPEYYTPDTGPDPKEFFSSPAWETLLVDEAERALGAPITRTPLPDPTRLAIPVAREGARIRSDFWFPGEESGSLRLATPDGAIVWSGKPDAQGWLTLPGALRHDRYRATLTRGERSRTTELRIGGSADPEAFDVRLFALAHGGNPWGLAPGEAWERARDLREVGITSVVLMNHWRDRKQSYRDIRALREIIGAGLEVVYMQSLRIPHFGKQWPFDGPAPAQVYRADGSYAGWDMHDEAFRKGVDQLLDVVPEVRSMPAIRALQVIEEYHDGGITTPALMGELKRAGLTGKERAGGAGMYERQLIRSNATAETFQRFRRMAQRFLPGVPLSTYWPGSYWQKPEAYTARVGALADAVDQLLGPGYGYQNKPVDTGWLSVVRSAADVFAAHGHRLAPGRGSAVYAMGRDIRKGQRPIRARAWRDTAWTALAHGTTQLAYFDLAYGDALEPLGPLNRELTHLGPWIAAAPRRPAAVAVLGSWTTRTAGSPAEAARHAECLSTIHQTLAAYWEEVDILLEEQLPNAPAELRAIVVAGAPLLTAETVAALNGFVQSGGSLIVEPSAGTRGPDGPRSGDPWALARRSGRVHDTPFNKRCSGTPSWLATLGGDGVAARSDTEDRRTEARLRGDDEILYWFLLNHREDATTVAGRARIDPRAYTWRDLRSNSAVRFEGGGDARLSRRLEPGDAAAFIGVRRPAATLRIEANANATRVDLHARAFDAAGQPVANGYPLRLEVVDAKGESRVAPNARSRTTRDGAARWSLPIPVDTGAASWSIRVTEPISGKSAATEVPIASWPAAN